MRGLVRPGFLLIRLLVLADDKGHGKDKPSQKKPLSEAQLEQRRKAGKSRAKSFTKEYQSIAGKARAKAFTKEYQSSAGRAMHAKRGTEHLRRIGRQGWMATLARHPEFYEQGGRVSRKLALARLEQLKRAKEQPGRDTPAD